MSRAGLSRAVIVETAAAVADEVGFDGLTMGLVAGRLGVRTPSLYRHIGSLDALRRGVAMHVAREIGEVAARSAVGRSGRDAVHAFADAYRRWVLDHPGRYAASVRAPDPGDEEHRRVGDESVRVLLDVLAGLGLRGADGVDAARALRAAIHGFTSLESAGGFGLPCDVDRSYRFLVDVVVDGLRGVS